MREEEFYQALKEFLFNGRCYRRDVIPGLVVMLKKLREVIRQQDSFRFFTSSLLIVYDGAGKEMEEEEGEGADRKDGIMDDHETTAPEKSVKSNLSGATQSASNGFNLQELRKQVDVRMIDFARSTHHGMTDQSSYLGPDEGYIQGLTTLISVFESILRSL